MNRSKTRRDIESLIKNLLKKEKSHINGFIGNFYRTLEK